MLAPGDVIMRVLYDFSAEDRAELSLYEGQVREGRGRGGGGREREGRWREGEGEEPWLRG